MLKKTCSFFLQNSYKFQNVRAHNVFGIQSTGITKYSGIKPQWVQKKINTNLHEQFKTYIWKTYWTTFHTPLIKVPKSRNFVAEMMRQTERFDVDSLSEHLCTFPSYGGIALSYHFTRSWDAYVIMWINLRWRTIAKVRYSDEIWLPIQNRESNKLFTANNQFLTKQTCKKYYRQKNSRHWRLLSDVPGRWGRYRKPPLEFSPPSGAKGIRPWNMLMPNMTLNFCFTSKKILTVVHREEEERSNPWDSIVFW